MEYSRKFGSNMPYSPIELSEKKDIDNSIVYLVNQYNEYVSKGDLVSASKIYSENRDILESYIIDARYINKLEEEIYNSCVAVSRNYSIVNDSEPSKESQDINGIWYQEM